MLGDRPVIESEVSVASESHCGVADGAPPEVTYLPFQVPSAEVT